MAPVLRKDKHDLPPRKDSYDTIPQKDSQEKFRGSCAPILAEDLGPTCSQNGVAIPSETTQFLPQIHGPMKLANETVVPGERDGLPQQLQTVPGTRVSEPAALSTTATFQPQSQTDQSNRIPCEQPIPTIAYPNQILSPIQLMSQANAVQGQVPLANQINIRHQVASPSAQVVQPSHDGMGQIPMQVMMSPYTGQILSPIHVVPPSYEDVQLRQQSGYPSQNTMAAPYGRQANFQQQMPMSPPQVVSTISYPPGQAAPIHFAQVQPIRRHYRQPYPVSNMSLNIYVVSLI